MNILFYCDEYPPYTTGGIGTVTKIIAEELVKRGHNIFIIGYYPYNTKFKERTTINGVTIIRLNLKLRTGFIKYNFFRIINKLNLSQRIFSKELEYTESYIEDFISQNKIDIFEIPDYFSFNYAPQELKFKKFNVPTILRIHGCISFLMDIKKRSNKINHINDFNHFKRCDYISAVSNYSLKYILNNFQGINMESVIIHNPIEDYFIKNNLPSSNKNILFIGRLTETKGCFSLLKAFNSIAIYHNDWQLILIGDGELKKAKKLIDPKISDRVKFLGYCSRDKIIHEIDNCAFACIPSYGETFSMVTIEIMSRKRCVIFTERTSGPEIIKNSSNGVLVNPYNIKQIGQTINALIENPDTRNDLAEKAFEFINKNLKVSYIGNKIESFYNEILYKYNNHD